MKMGSQSRRSSKSFFLFYFRKRSIDLSSNEYIIYNKKTGNVLSIFIVISIVLWHHGNRFSTIVDVKHSFKSYLQRFKPTKIWDIPTNNMNIAFMYNIIHFSICVCSINPKVCVASYL